jgi:hypothetical protein
MLAGTLLLIITAPLLLQDVNAQQVEFSDAELAQILAPIALYPDSLLTHILIASTYPLEIVQAQRWRTANSHLNTEQAIQQAENKNWDPSVTALLAFPNVLRRLNDDLRWTQKLGDAFLQDETRLLSSIQMLREQADRADSLSAMDNMSVTRVDKQIIIEPVEKEIIYVPYYDSRIVYGHWHWYNYPPVYWPPYPYYRLPSVGLFYWGSGIHIRFNYYFSSFNWQRRHIVVIHHHNSHRYRPRARIINSQGAQRWQHKPYHRHGVAYRSQQVQQRYNVSPLRITGAQQVENKLHRQRAQSKENHRYQSPAVNKPRLSRQPAKREQHFIKRKEQFPVSSADRGVNNQLPRKSHKEVKTYRPEQRESYHRPQRDVKREKLLKVYPLQQHRIKPRSKKHAND